MRLNPNKTQSMIVSRSRTVFPPHTDLLVGSTHVTFKILGVTFDSKFTFESPICSSAAQKTGLLRNVLESLGIMMSY